MSSPPYGPSVVVLVSRSRSQPPPPHVVLQALLEPDSDPTRPWLHLRPDEVRPRVLRVEGSRVVWSSIFAQQPQAEVQFDVTGHRAGSDLRWTLLDVADPGPATTRRLRTRLDEITNRDLRHSFGQ